MLITGSVLMHFALGFCSAMLVGTAIYNGYRKLLWLARRKQAERDLLAVRVLNRLQRAARGY